MQNEKLKARLNNLYEKTFILDGAEYFCLDWKDNEAAHCITIATTKGFLPEIEYRNVAAFLDKIQIVAGDEDSVGEKGVVKAGEPFLPQMPREMLDRHNVENQTMSSHLLKMAEELSKGAVTANAIERAKHLAQLAIAQTNLHKAQTNGIVEVGKLFLIKSKGQGKQSDDQSGQKQIKE